MRHGAPPVLLGGDGPFGDPAAHVEVMTPSSRAASATVMAVVSWWRGGSGSRGSSSGVRRPGHHRGGERRPGALAAALPVEDPGDDRVGAACGEAADQRNGSSLVRIFGGAWRGSVMVRSVSAPPRQRGEVGCDLAALSTRMTLCRAGAEQFFASRSVVVGGPTPRSMSSLRARIAVPLAGSGFSGRSLRGGRVRLRRRPGRAAFPQSASRPRATSRLPGSRPGNGVRPWRLW